MTFKIALNFEDGVTRFIDCNATETVADAAYRQGVNVPIDCRDGACGACKCKAESGKYELGFYIDDAMSEEEAKLGYVLTCQMHPKSDCVVNVPASSEVCKIKHATLTATVAEVRQLSPSTLSLVLQGEGIAKLAFLPGQYANLTVPGTEQTRAYSFSSAPGSSALTFLIRDVPNGMMSEFMRMKAKIEDFMMFTGPYGSFYLRPPTRPILMLAGGTGLAPFLSMLQYLKDHPTDQPITLAYGVNTNDDLVELPQLDYLKSVLPKFDYFTCVVDKESGHPKRGYVTEHLSKETLQGGNVDVYVCGPPPMVEGVRKWMEGVGVTPKNFLFEKFSSANEAAAAKEGAAS